MIEITDVSFAYKHAPRPVLHGFSATFAAATVTALTGANACGKTTLTKLMVGIERPTAGSVVVDGTDVAHLSLAEIGRRVGYVHQNAAHQIFCSSVREEMSYGLRNLGLDDGEMERRIHRSLDYFDLAGHDDDFPLNLSQGERQRLMLAVILSMQPSYVVLDEPTTGLDLVRRQALGAYLRRIADGEGCGVVVVSHERGFVSRFADVELRMADPERATSTGCERC
jgi:energy-coupling factor transport system ATP-binding protein